MRRRRNYIFLIIFFIPMIVPTQGSVAFTTELISEADSGVKSTSPTTNTGGEYDITVSNEGYPQYRIRIGYIRFDLSGISGRVKSAVLKLKTSTVTETHTIGIHECVGASWNELTVNYNNKPSYSSTALDTTLVASDWSWYSWVVTDAVQNALNGNKVTFAIISEDEHGTAWVDFYSKDQQSWNEEDRPVLEIEYTIAPLGSIEIDCILEDKESYKKTVEITTTDLLEITIEIDRSSIDLSFLINGEEIGDTFSIKDRFSKKLAFEDNGTVTMKLSNPGLLSGGDEIQVSGYIIISPNQADQAEITFAVEPFPIEVLLIIIFVSILFITSNIIYWKRKKKAEDHDDKIFFTKNFEERLETDISFKDVDKMPEIRSNHKLLSKLTATEKIVYMNKSRTTFILTNQRLLVHGQNTHKSGDRKGDVFRHEYIFPINQISSIHRTGSLFRSLTIDASGTTYSFIFAPGTDELGRKNQMGREEIIQHIASLISEIQTTPAKPSEKIDIHPNVCPSCSEANPQRAKFCNQCGATFGRICPNCNSTNDKSSAFCNECGSKLYQ